MGETTDLAKHEKKFRLSSSSDRHTFFHSGATEPFFLLLEEGVSLVS